MDVKSVMDARRFAADKLSKVSLFESEKMFCDVYGVSPGQEQKPGETGGAQVPAGRGVEPGDHRSASGNGFRGSGPMYSDWGRKRRL